MKVEIIDATANPASVISRAAATSYGKRDTKLNRVEHCFNSGHMSVFEHAHCALLIEGISRSCSHQLVRHRLASFVQESQRYVRLDTDIIPRNRDSWWYVIPPDMRRTPSLLRKFHETMKTYARNYQEALDDGIKPEDARYLLPEASKTAITMTVNVRELFHFFDMRLDKAAQWEIRELANQIKESLKNLGGEWQWLMELYEERS